jgi:hypothetical protein
MAVALRMLLPAMIVAISAQLIAAQKSQAKVTITEPGVYELAGLFKQADSRAGRVCNLYKLLSKYGHQSSRILDYGD